jgi:hypothetical protein
MVCEIFSFLNQKWEVGSQDNEYHPLLLWYNECVSRIVKCMITLWDEMDATIVEKQLVWDTCLFHIHQTKSYPDIKSFRLDCDPVCMRNSYKKYKIQQRRYDSHPDAQSIRRSVVERTQKVFFECARRVLEEGRWMDATPTGAVLLVLHGNSFHYGYFPAQISNTGIDELVYTCRTY